MNLINKNRTQEELTNLTL